MRKSRFFLLLAIALGIGIVFARGELRETPLPRNVDTPSEFASFLETSLPAWMERYRVPAVCTGLVAGDLERVVCAGTTRSDGGVAIGSQSRFGVASVSKAFTALAVLTLAAHGAIALDDPAERHLRSWHFPRKPFDGSALTIRQLLTHTAGVGVASYGGAGSPRAGETTRDVLDGRGSGRAPVRLVAAPGSGFRYSGGGYMVLQQLVEDVAGRPFEQFVIDNVFQPLGMRDSSFSWGAARDGDSAGHDVAGQPLPAHPYGAAMAPGAMVTTADDLLRFTAAFARGQVGARLGWPEGLWRQYVAADQGHYGLGLTLTEANGHLLLGHSGTTMGYNAGFNASPAEGFGWFVLENGNGGGFLNSELNRLALQWKTGAVDPRHRAMKVFCAAVAFLGTTLPALGVLLLASFGLRLAFGQRRWLWTSGGAPLAKGLRGVLAVLLAGAGALWLAVFHTEAFYPALTTAWMPYTFRFATLGVLLIALRGILACLFVRPRTVTEPAAV